MRFLITGASGFIGSTIIQHITDASEVPIRAFARNTNQRNLKRLTERTIVNNLIIQNDIELVYGDLLGDISGLCEGVDVVINCAAKTFVDHSIRDPEAFTQTNVVGTLRLLEEARRNKVGKFIQVSTDEVYGAISEGMHTEESPLKPSNPYSASKAAADSLVMSYATTYGLNTLVVRTENNFGYF